MLRAIDKWGIGYLRSIGRRPAPVDGTRHLLFCVADHFEPYRGGVSDDVAMERLKPWCDNYMKAVDSFRDADGCTPRHTFFYPQEEYNEKALDMLGDLCRKGAGEVEIHLHHRNDTADGLREKLVGFRDVLHEQHGFFGLRTTDHGLQGAGLIGSEKKCTDYEGLGSPRRNSSKARRSEGPSRWEEASQRNEGKRRGVIEGQPAFAFVHGNWALCNSRPDGDWCGVNEELGVLSEAGCYADFTFPSAPSPTQPRMVNAIYRAKDVSGKPRSADCGVLSEVRENLTDYEGLGSPRRNSSKVRRSEGPSRREEASQRNEGKRREEGDELLLITGPLALNWKRRKFGVLPRLENAEISGNNPATADSVDLWARQGIHVQGRPEWVFVKTHTHGCVPQNASIFLESNHVLRFTLHDHLHEHYNDRERWCLHYVTAREMYNIVRAAEDGKTGNPGDYRDYEVEKPSLNP